MTRRLPTIVTLIVAAHGGGCGSKKDAKSSPHDPAAEAVEVDAAQAKEDAAVVTATVLESSPNTQVIRAPASSGIAGALAAFLPGSFDVDFAVSLYQGRSIAKRQNLKSLGFGD